jgi:hypothetical protein
MGTLLLGILIVGLTILVAIGCQLLIHRRVPLHIRQKHNDVAGFIYAVLGVIYGALLAFVVVLVWEEFTDARINANREANHLAIVYQLSSQFPEAQRQPIQDLIRSYMQVVVDEEWQLMASGQASPRAWQLFDDLSQTIQQTEPMTGREQAIYEQALNQITDIGERRRDRLLASRDAIPQAFWIVSIALAVITIVFAYLFGLENTIAHALMIGALTAAIVSILFLIHALDLPFTGDVRVLPEEFELVLQQLG